MTKRFVLFVTILNMTAALFWTTLAMALALGPKVGPETLYFIAAAFIVGTGILEGSYAVAYHDELTGLLGRRAYKRLATHLSGAYAIAVVDMGRTSVGTGPSEPVRGPERS